MLLGEMTDIYCDNLMRNIIYSVGKIQSSLLCHRFVLCSLANSRCYPKIKLCNLGPLMDRSIRIV